MKVIYIISSLAHDNRYEHNPYIEGVFDDLDFAQEIKERLEQAYPSLNFKLDNQELYTRADDRVQGEAN